MVVRAVVRALRMNIVVLESLLCRLFLALFQPELELIVEQNGSSANL